MVRQGTDRGRLAERAHDLYETPPCATRALIKTGILDTFRAIWEPCAGRGAISRVLTAGGWRVTSTELAAYIDTDADVRQGVDFFKVRGEPPGEAIVTNPPFHAADDFVRHALTFDVPVFVLQRLVALEGARRSDILERLSHVWIGIERLPKFQREGWTGKRIEVETAPFAWFLFVPYRRQGEGFTASRISWRESHELQDRRFRGSAAPDDGTPQVEPQSDG